MDTLISPLRKSGAMLITINEVDFSAFRSLSATLCIAITLALAIGTKRTE